MFLKTLSLQNFRNYSKSTFRFSNTTTVIVGPNTAGKTNLIEAIYLLSHGKSFRAEKDYQMILFNKELARVRAEVLEGKEGLDIQLEVILTTGNVAGVDAPFKKFMVNGVAKRRVDFITHLPSVLFAPSDLDMIVGSPSLRRNFLDSAIEQVDRAYSISLIAYGKALRQRNALLELSKETGKRSERQFEYWDNLLIEHGQIIAQKREEFFDFINGAKKEIFDFTVFYDKSVMSKERLLQYKDAEAGAGVTLVGPHRDDFSIRMHLNIKDANNSESMEVKFFGSRGQQRLVVLQLKLLQLEFMEKSLEKRPLFLLDDIFSELDNAHIKLVMEMVGLQQTILTTTHEEFLSKTFKASDMIKLG